VVAILFEKLMECSSAHSNPIYNEVFQLPTELNSLELFLCSYSDPEVIEMRV